MNKHWNHLDGSSTATFFCLFSTADPLGSFGCWRYFSRWNQFHPKMSLDEKSHVPKIQAIHKLVDPFLTMSTSQSLTKWQDFGWVVFLSKDLRPQNPTSSSSFLFLCVGEDPSIWIWGGVGLHCFFYLGQIYLASRKNHPRICWKSWELFWHRAPNRKSIPKLRAKTWKFSKVITL